MAGENSQVSFIIIIIIFLSTTTRGEREERGRHSRSHKQGYRSPGLSCGPVRDNGHTQGIPDARNTSWEHRLAEDESEIPGQVQTSIGPGRVGEQSSQGQREVFSPVHVERGEARSIQVGKRIHPRVRSGIPSGERAGGDELNGGGYNRVP